jgi:hypothetical protein
MSITVKCDGGADVVLYKTELEEFAQEIFKTRVGIRSLTKLGLAVGYESLGGNGWHLRAMRGKPKSIEHREKISKSMKGRPSHFKGRTTKRFTVLIALWTKSARCLNQ